MINKNLSLLLSGVFLFISFSTYSQIEHSFDQKRKTGKAGEFHVKKTVSSDLVVNNSNQLFISNRGGQVVGFTVSRDQDGVIYRIDGGIRGKRSKLASNISQEVFEYIETVSSVMNTDSDANSWRPLKVINTGNGSHHKFQQYINEIPVYGGEIIVHVKNGDVTGLSGRWVSDKDFDTVLLQESTAISIAINDLPSGTVMEELSSDFKALYGEQYLVRKEIFVVDLTKSVITYHVTVRPNNIERWEYFIDSHTGAIVSKYNHTCAIDGPAIASAIDLNGVDHNINTYLVGNTYYLIDASKTMFNAPFSTFPDDPIGVITTYDYQNSSEDFSFVTSENNTWDSETAVSAHKNAELAYQYFENTHQRNSINGGGGNVISFINVADQDGLGMDNAYWNGEAIFYGNGATFFYPLAGGLDVAGHEMAHGVVSNTANLEYYGQSGALNESFADIFGAMIDRDDWLIGEDIVRPGLNPNNALRNMMDPHNGLGSLGEFGYQPKTMAEYYTGTDDNAGVHINSGIVNYAFYLFATAIGKDKAEQIYYHALNTQLTKFSKFVDLRAAVIECAKDLYSDSEIEAAVAAFDAVGIFAGSSSDPFVELPTHPDGGLVLGVDVDETIDVSLFLSDESATSFSAISNTSIVSRPSVTDNGELAVFVTNNGNIRMIDLATPYDEYIISDDSIWSSVAISKDGQRIAAVTSIEDSSIYVYDIVSQEWARFMLYNPTFTEGVQTGGVIYADAIEWDYSGEVLIYDAFNVLENKEGEDLDYWDVGFLKVWDTEKDDFGDGSIEKLFTGLPEGVSIGNPSLSKLSPHLIAFDYLDVQNLVLFQVVANTITGEIGTIAQNYVLGFPNFSRNDEELIYNFINGGDTVIAVRGLASSKMAPSTDAFLFIPKAKWGTWLPLGERDLEVLSAANDLISLSFTEFSPTIIGQLVNDTIKVTVPIGTDLTNLTPTFILSENALTIVEGRTITSGESIIDFSDDVRWVVQAENGSSKEYVVIVNEEVASSVGGYTVIDARVFPNPFKSFITVDLSGEEFLSFELTSISGADFTPVINRLENDLRIDQSIPSGIYVLKVSTLRGDKFFQLIKD